MIVINSSASNTNFEAEEFLNLMQDTMNENSRQDELEKFKKEFVDIKSKKSKLIDLMVEDKISENDYNEKVEKYNRKLEILENKIEQLKLLAEDKKSISDGLKKVRELLDSKDIIEDFDQEIFNAIVDYVIVGGYDENGVIDPYLIRFILKREFDLSVPKDVPDETSQWTVDTTVVTPIEVGEDKGMRLGGRFQPLIPVSCRNCGNTVFINGLILGCLDNVEEEKKEGEDIESK